MLMVRSPRRASSVAIEEPTMPAPITTASAWRKGMRYTDPVFLPKLRRQVVEGGGVVGESLASESLVKYLYSYPAASIPARRNKKERAASGIRARAADSLVRYPESNRVSSKLLRFVAKRK